MSRTSMIAAVVAAISLVAVSGVGAAPIEAISTNPTSLAMPEGYSPGLWYGLPEEDRRAILGEPYPNRLSPGPAAANGGRTAPAPPASDTSSCWGLSSRPRAC